MQHESNVESNSLRTYLMIPVIELIILRPGHPRVQSQSSVGVIADSGFSQTFVSGPDCKLKAQSTSKSWNSRSKEQSSLSWLHPPRRLLRRPYKQQTPIICNFLQFVMLIRFLGWIYWGCRWDRNSKCNVFEKHIPKLTNIELCDWIVYHNVLSSCHFGFTNLDRWKIYSILVLICYHFYLPWLTWWFLSAASTSNAILHPKCLVKLVN